MGISENVDVAALDMRIQCRVVEDARALGIDVHVGLVLRDLLVAVLGAVDQGEHEARRGAVLGRLAQLDAHAAALGQVGLLDQVADDFGGSSGQLEHVISSVVRANSAGYP